MWRALALHFPAPEQRPWLQVFGLGVQTESFLHRRRLSPYKGRIRSTVPLQRKDPVRAQEKWNFFSQPFESPAASSSFAASRPDLDKIDW